MCSRKIANEDSALDHDHTTGKVRCTLHRNCNSIEGRILHWARRSGIDPKEFIGNLLEYWKQEYSDNPLHPNHRTETEKRVRVLKRRMRKAKRSSTKTRLRQEIKELESQNEQQD